MNTKIKLLLPTLLTLIASAPAFADPAPSQWLSLEPSPKPLPAGNPTDDKGIIRNFNAPTLHITHSSLPQSHGTVLLFPGGAYKILDTLNEGSLTAASLNADGYDVITLEYHISSGPTTRDLALQDAFDTWQLLQKSPQLLGLHPNRSILMGYSAGGHLAARLTQKLAATPDVPQPDDLILVYPAYLEESSPGSTTPTVQPPAHPTTRLVAMMAANDRPNWLKGCRDYVDAWKHNGGYAIFHPFKDGGHGFGMKPDRTGDITDYPKILNYFLENGPLPGVGPFNTLLPWYLPNRDQRLAAFAKNKSADQSSIVFLGDSITAKWNLNDAFPDLKVANRGISGDTTRGMFCRFQDNVLDLHPKAIVLMGGINDFTQDPQGTPQTIAANIRSILEQLHTQTPDTPILVCEILPTHSVPDESIRAANTAVDEVLKNFPNAHRIKTHDLYLNPDNTQNRSLFLDGTHPNPTGYTLWQKSLQPELKKYTP